MFFSPNRKFNERDTQLVKQVLEKFVGRTKAYCHKKAEEKGFILLDRWDNKMGFVKEEGNKYQILSLQFENSKCQFYQVIVKEEGENWSDGKIIDYNLVRDLGIIPKDGQRK